MANYLLVSFSASNLVPDDLSIVTLPRGQVDYLSHNWQEEDVWRSWRNMTKQKNEIANGMRLENASWRTWWKQRNKLKTVTPETLNWLKDSDVTWLYGPLHTADDSTPPSKPKPLPDSSNTVDLTFAKKPILKHRSISELLTSDLPSPLFSPADSDDEDAAPTEGEDGSKLGRCPRSPKKRPLLWHTKSDTNITNWSAKNSLYRKTSPSSVLPVYSGRFSAPHSNSNLASYFQPGSASRSPSSSHGTDRDNSPPSAGGAGSTTSGKKKHITFNTFVAQCIAIEKPKKTSPLGRGVYMHGFDVDVEGEDSTVWSGHRHVSDRDSDSGLEDEDDEDVLEMRTSSSTIVPKARSKSKASTSSSSSSSSNDPTRYRPPLLRNNSFDRERATIAPIAPTMLKTTDVEDEGEDWLDPFHPDADVSSSFERDPVELVYVPPIGINHIPQEEGVLEDMYHNPNSYLTFESGENLPALATSPHAVGNPIAVLEDAHDSLGSPELGENSTQHPPRQSEDADRERDNNAGRNGVGMEAPEVVIDEASVVSGRSRSRTPSPQLASSTSPSATLPVPRPRGRSASYSPPTLLSPPARGRSGIHKSSSATQLCADAQNQSRGRSSTRTSSSVSDRERSRGGSPLGSLSPDGSPLALRAGGRTLYGNGRTERGERGKTGCGKGRERTESRLSVSLSPDDVLRNRDDGQNTTNSLSSVDTVVPLIETKPVDIAGAADSVPQTTPPISIPIPTSLPQEESARKEAEVHIPQAQKQASIHPPQTQHTRKSSLTLFNPPPSSPTSPIYHDSPTLSSSPVSVPRAHTSRASPASSPASPTVAMARKWGNGKAMSGSGPSMPASTGVADGYEADNPTLVGRIVSSAGVYLGLWHNGAA